MFKSIRRIFAVLTHRHDWQIICSARMRIDITYFYLDKQETIRTPCVLERCHCGKERAYYFNHAQKRVSLDPVWFRLEANEKGANIPDDVVLRKK